MYITSNSKVQISYSVFNEIHLYHNGHYGLSESSFSNN